MNCSKEVMMIDTVKLTMNLSKPLRKSDLDFQLMKEQEKGVIQGIYNPTAIMKKTGKYYPRLTYTERPTRGGKTYQLAIELSVPKLVFNNNFDELTDDDYPTVLKALSDVLREMKSLWLFKFQIGKLEVSKIDYSKNIVLDNGMPVSYITNIVRRADISKVYDVEKDSFRNGGHIFHIHTNALDVALYDKVEDLKQSIKSPKRAYESDNLVQQNLIDAFNKNRNVSVLRVEVRLNGKKQIRSMLNKVGLPSDDLTFDRLFSSDISSKIVDYHWQKILSKVPKAQLDFNTPENILVKLLSNDNVRPMNLLASLGFYSLMSGSDDGRNARNLIEKKLGNKAWYRLTKGVLPLPEDDNLKVLTKITDAIRRKEPTRMKKYFLLL